MKSIPILVVSLCAGMLLAGSGPLRAQTADAGARSDQELAKENATLRRQNAELRERLRRLEASARSKSSRPEPQSNPNAAMAADLPVKGPVARPAGPPQASGYIEAYTGAAWSRDSVNSLLFGTEDLNYDGWVIGGAGRGNLWATPNISFQLDAQAEGTQYRTPSEFLPAGFSSHFSTLSYLIGAHANWRDPRVGLLGVFGGIGDAGGNEATAGFVNTGVRHGVIGLEGQYYWNALTLYGQVGYDATINGSDLALFANAHQWFVRGTGRYFFTPDVMLEGTVQYADGELGHSDAFSGGLGDTDFNTWLWRAKAEWRPGTVPLSVFATYQGSRTSFGSAALIGLVSEKMTDNRVMAGVRFYLGQDTLLANDRTGATLDIIDPLGLPTSPLMLFPLGQEVFVSDARLKRDIALVGRLADGLGLYRYRYLWSDTVYVGVMAQEVALLHPDAVVHGADGYLRVNYTRLGLKLMTLPEWRAREAAATL